MDGSICAASPSCPPTRSPNTCAPHGLAASTVVRAIWQAHGLSPHRWRQFKLSNDPEFAKKLTDVVGLYVAPPAHAVVLSVDEKSQIQALDRTQPGLPLKKGRGPTMTHDYKRNGTTTLFAALNVLTGEVLSKNMQRHTLPGRGLPANHEGASGIHPFSEPSSQA